MTDTEIQNQLATAMVNAMEAETPPSPKPVRLLPKDQSLTDQLTRIESINRQIRDKVRRRRMELKIEMDRRAIDIESSFQRRLANIEDERQAELRRAADELLKELDELTALERRLETSS
jgi:hypothetical protein